MHNRVYNKTNTIKLTKQKSFQQKGKISDWERMQQIIHSQNKEISYE